jgi:hypothetical protein
MSLQIYKFRRKDTVPRKPKHLRRKETVRKRRENTENAELT